MVKNEEPVQERVKKEEESGRKETVKETVEKERKTGGGRRQRWENTNKNKNIIPNTINRMISFLSCRARSSSILEKFLQHNPQISHHVTAKMYFAYIKQVKLKMNRCLME